MTWIPFSSRARDDMAAWPGVTPQQRDELTRQAIEDAMDVIVDSHDLDPRQVLGRLVRWQGEPLRLVMAAYALALMHDPHTPGSVLERNLTSVMRHEEVA